MRTESEVRRTRTEDGRATGVEPTSGERIGAKRTVVANLTPAAFFEGLLSPEVPVANR